MKPMIFLRTGWMKNYNGLVNDVLVSGDAFSEEYGYGYEIFNFAPYKGHMYGYFYLDGSINIDRLGAHEKDDSIDNVLVVWVSRSRSGGVFIIGWYRNATIYRDYQQAPKGSKRKYKGDRIGYRVKAKAEDCKILPLDARVFSIPTNYAGGMGQANIWYTDKDIHASFREQVLNYISSGIIPRASQSKIKLRKHRSIDPYTRHQIEKKAIELTVKYYERLGYSVGSVEKDNVGWDLVATMPDKNLLLEVKGLSQKEISIALTPNEYTQMKNHVDRYRICVVTNALDKNSLLTIFSFSFESGQWEDEEGIPLNITKLIGAKMVALNPSAKYKRKMRKGTGQSSKS